MEGSPPSESGGPRQAVAHAPARANVTHPEGASASVETAVAPTSIEPRANRPAGPWSRLRRRTRREIILALTLLFMYGFFRQVPVWNEYSRYDLVRALVEERTTRIDSYQDNTGDKAYFQGHSYSDKAPGSAFLGVPVYVVMTVLSGAAGSGTPDPPAAVEALAFVECGIATVLLVLLLIRFLRPAVGERWALLVSLGYGLGSIALPFATMFFGHAPTAFFLFAAFYVLWQTQAGEHSGRLPALAGLLAGLAVLVDVSAMLGVVVLLCYASASAQPAGRRLGKVNWRAPALMVAGAALPAAMLLSYNWVSFGAPFKLGYDSLASGGFASGMGQGILGVSWPSTGALVDLLVGPRGLLRLAPWFALVPVGLLAVRRRGLRREVLVCGAIVVAFLAFNAGYYLPFGGWTPGPRFLLPALPFAAVLVALAPRALRPLTATLIAVAVVFMFVATATMPNAPELYRDPLTDLWLPRLIGGDLADTIAWERWGVHGPQPLLVLLGGLAVGAIAMLAAYRPGAPAKRLSGVLAGALAVPMVAFALPIGPPLAFDLAGAGASAGAADSVAIVDVGGASVRRGDTPTTSIWAQAVNRGPALSDTRVVFTVLTTDGRQEWSASYSGVTWWAGEHKSLSVDWDTTQVRAGDYRVEVTVVAQDQKTVLAGGSAASPLRVGP